MNVVKGNFNRIPTPERVFNKFGEWFDSNKRIAFIVAIIVGIVTNVILLSVLIMSPDGLWNSIVYSASGFEITIGRWAITYMDNLRDNIAMPTITTVYSIIITAITAVFLVDFFELKSKISIVITSAFLGVSPCLAITLIYEYTADCYCWAFLFAVISAWIIFKRRYRRLEVILSALFTMLSMALYQSYLGVSVGLCIFKILLVSLNKDKKYKEIFIDIFYSIIAVMLGIVFYYCSVKLILYHYNINLATYKGANEVGILNIVKNLTITIPNTYKAFLDFFVENNIVNNSNMNRDILWRIFFCTIIIAYIYIVFKDKKYSIKERVVNFIFNIIILSIVPIGLNIINIIVPDTSFYTLNSAQMLIVVPFGMSILECMGINEGAILKWISLVTCIIICITYYLAINASYMVIRIKYNQVYATSLRAIDRIENTEGYTKRKPWMFAGVVYKTDTYGLYTFLENYTLNSIDNVSVFHRDYYGALGTWTKFLNQFFGIEPNFCTQKEFKEIVNTDDFKKMPIFPEDGSVREINGVMVVKFESEPKTD